MRVSKCCSPGLLHRQRARILWWWCLTIRNGVYRIARRAWKFDACRDRVTIASISAARPLSYTGAKVTINNWRMSPWLKIENYSKQWYPYCTTAKVLLRNKDLSYEEIDVSLDAVREQDED